MRRRSFFARCAAALAGLFGVTRAPASRPFAVRSECHATHPAKNALVVAGRSAGSKAKGRALRSASDGEPCWLFEANRQPLKEGCLYIAILCDGIFEDGWPVYITNANG